MFRYRSQFDSYRPEFLVLPQPGDPSPRKTYGPWTFELFRHGGDAHDYRDCMRITLLDVSPGPIVWDVKYNPTYTRLTDNDMRFTSEAQRIQFLKEVEKVRAIEALRVKKERALARKQERLQEAKTQGLTLKEYEDGLRVKRQEERSIAQAERFSEASNIMLRLAEPLTRLRESFERYERACKEAPAHLTFTRVDKTIQSIEYATKSINQWSKKALGKSNKEKTL